LVTRRRCARSCGRAATPRVTQSLPLTQELLAQMIGVQRNAVSFVAHALQQAGVISYSPGASRNQ
jgi:CRP-like cAMP-binding protein